MNPDLLIDAVLQPLGGRFDTSAFLEKCPIRIMERTAIDLCHFVAARELHKKAPLYFAYINSIKIRATSTVKQAGIVAVSIGTVAIFLEVFDRLMSDPSFLADIGHPQRETTEVYPSSISLISDDTGSIDWNRQITTCPIRHRVGIELAILAFSFLVSHEITHIQQGHLNLLASLSEPSSINESVSEGHRLSLTLQAMELLADYEAAARVLRRSLGLRSDIPYERYRKHDRKALKAIYGNTPHKTVYFVMLAIAMAWRIFDEQPWAPEKLEQRTHPPIAVRQLSLSTHIGKWLRERPHFGVSPDQAASLVVKAQIDAEIGFLKLTGNEKDMRPYEVLLEETPTMKHLEKLLAAIPKLLEQLEPFSWGQPGIQLPNP